MPLNDGNRSGRWGKGNSNIREDQLLAVMRSAHALMIAGDSDTAGRLLAVFAYTGVDAGC